MKQLSFSYRVSTDVSAGQCLKFCDDTPSAAMLPSLFQQDGAPAHRSRDCETVGIPPLMSRKTLGILDGGRGGAVDRARRRRGMTGVDKGGA